MFRFGKFDQSNATVDDEEHQDELSIWNSLPRGSVFEKIEELRKFWKKPFEEILEAGEEASNKTELYCNTACTNNKTLLGVCRTFVDYTFCGRKLKIGQSFMHGYQANNYVHFLDTVAKDCVENTVWKQRDVVFDKTSDCYNSVLQGACSMLFPKCDPGGKPMPVCRSVCENERKSCQTSGSNFGGKEEITHACAASPFVDDAYPSAICTGTGNSHFEHRSYKIQIGLTILLVPLFF